MTTPHGKPDDDEQEETDFSANRHYLDDPDWQVGEDSETGVGGTVFMVVVLLLAFAWAFYAMGFYEKVFGKHLPPPAARAEYDASPATMGWSDVTSCGQSSTGTAAASSVVTRATCTQKYPSLDPLRVLDFIRDRCQGVIYVQRESESWAGVKARLGTNLKPGSCVVFRRAEQPVINDLGGLGPNVAYLGGLFGTKTR